MLACLIGGKRKLFFTLVVGEADTEVGHADHMRAQMHNLRYFPRSMETGLVEVSFSHREPNLPQGVLIGLGLDLGKDLSVSDLNVRLQFCKIVQLLSSGLLLHQLKIS